MKINLPFIKEFGNKDFVAGYKKTLKDIVPGVKSTNINYEGGIFSVFYSSKNADYDKMLEEVNKKIEERKKELAARKEETEKLKAAQRLEEEKETAREEVLNFFGDNGKFEEIVYSIEDKYWAADLYYDEFDDLIGGAEITPKIKDNILKSFDKAMINTKNELYKQVCGLSDAKKKIEKILDDGLKKVEDFKKKYGEDALKYEE